MYWFIRDNVKIADSYRGQRRSWTPAAPKQLRMRRKIRDTNVNSKSKF